MSIEDKYDEVRQLINIGKEKGYLLYDEVNELLPSEITSSEELDDLFNTFGSAGIEVLDSDKEVPGREGASTARRRAPRSSSSISRRARSTRPTTRSACTCARWARCRCSPARARWRSPSASSAASCRSSSRSRARRWSPRRCIQLGEDLKNEQRTIRELVTFSDEELTEDKIEDRKREVLRQIEAVRKARALVQKAEEKLETIPKKDKQKYRRGALEDAARRVELAGASARSSSPSSSSAG